MKNIAEILKNTREDKDLTQLDVMNATGINNKALSRYENGASEPDLATLVTLLNFYGLSADEVLEIKELDGELIGLKLSREEYSLILEFRKLDEASRHKLITALKAINE